jgi:tryptophan-rich sensory protein
MKEIVHDIVLLLVSIIICQLAGLIGSFATTPAIPGWYASLRKPAFTPPSSVFAPVWIILFLLMGCALFLVWRQGVRIPAVKWAILIFVIQLILNVLWSFAFFGMRSPLAGLIVICVLWIMIVVTIVAFFRLSTFAGILLIPYILWVSYAAVLNAAIFAIN